MEGCVASLSFSQFLGQLQETLLFRTLRGMFDYSIFSLYFLVLKKIGWN